MQIRWLRNRDERLFDHPRLATRTLGRAADSSFRKCIRLIVDATDFQSLVLRRPMGLHRLHHSRRGQWAFRLSGGLRLIVQPDKTQSVTIIVEISDYHRRRRR